jgi:hypothetical protein
MQKDIYKYINCSIRKIVGSCPWLAFAGGVGVRDVNIRIFRTGVRGFSYISDNVPRVFRIISFWFRDQLVVSVSECSRIYMTCNDLI